MQVSDKGGQGLGAGVGMSAWARLQGNPPETGGRPATAGPGPWKPPLCQLSPKEARNPTFEASDIWM